MGDECNWKGFWSGLKPWRQHYDRREIASRLRSFHLAQQRREVLHQNTPDLVVMPYSLAPFTGEMTSQLSTCNSQRLSLSRLADHY